MHERLTQLFATRYPSIRSQFPGEGRRRWHLRVLQEFWEAALRGEIPSASDGSNLSTDDDFTQDDDPFDRLTEGPELGLLLRTDYSNEDAWQAFRIKLQDVEKELAEAVKPDEPPQVPAPSGSEQDNAEDSDSDMESSDGIPSPIIKVVDPAPTERAFFTHISNLTALHLLNDVDIRQAPSPPAGEKRVHPPNRLVDQGTWQEVYSGMNLWIYDTQSNTDQCVRLVSQEGDFYGTATGDSWRVQGTHICELQFNMSFMGMMINFGGLDRWDYSERRRNLDEANQAIM
ncbi:hypothetical protein Hypma_008037 [Hypsizygus marmoreus]|uniref:Uncharacterized protein n=1 Tax=Hypsizygus marmoreus TaxID=39966 RepID=A0A369JXX1_HYPMA|nr:hypothetical protein Hypma_008037 [Hypsizygus marmoreus]